MKITPTPRSIDIALTKECNLRCSYCAHFTSPTDVALDLPTGEWLTFFQELNACGIISVCLQGGEVFCRKDLIEIIKGICDNKMRFSILTNATLINESAAEFIAKTKRCNYIQVSIDGQNAEVHDATRGKGSFIKILKGLNILRQYNLPVSARVTINKNNLYHIEAVAHFLLEDLRFESFSTNSACYQGMCRKNADSLQLDINDRSYAMQKFLNLSKKYPGRIFATAGPLADVFWWLNIIDKVKSNNNREGGNLSGYLGGCSGIFNTMAVRADGVMVPCLLMSHIELGRINKDSLKEVWQHHPEMQRLRLRGKIPLSNFEFCKDCIYISYCTGGCPAVTYNLLGTDCHPDPTICLKRFLEQGGILPHSLR